MSVAEMKKAIYDKVDKISSQEQLDVVLGVLNTFDEKEYNKMDVDALFEEIAQQYGDTLRRLAQ